MAFLGFIFWIFIIVGILCVAVNMLDADCYFGGFILIFYDAILALILWACIIYRTCCFKHSFGFNP